MKSQDIKPYILLILLSVYGGVTAQSHSVLSSGQWWKISVREEGIYRITTSDIPSLQGVAVAGLAVYGSDGAMLSTENSETSLDDLHQVAIEVTDHNGNGLFDSGDEILFYGQGTQRWVFDNSLRLWMFSGHAYANENYYYLTTTAQEPLRIATATAVTADTILTSHTVVTHIENDLVNIFESGQLWMGEKLSSALPQRTFDLRLPGTGISDVKLRYAVASKSATRATFDMSTTGYSNQLSTTDLSCYRTAVDLLSTASQSYTFTLAFNPAESSGSGYLDFIELTAHATLAYNGGQLIVRNDQHLGSTARFTVTGSTPARVWEVSHAGGERELTYNGGWSDATSEARTYLLFDGYTYFSPIAIDTVAPQDLHGATAAELVIVTHPNFLEQAQRLAGLHELFDNMTTLVATDQEVFNEFSSGKQDPMAIRSLLRWMKERHGAQPPRYLILFGKGSYDNRNILGNTTPTVVTYETPFSFDDDGLSYSSDDMLGYLAPNGHGSPSETLEIGVGRLPAKSVAEATHLVDKIERYMTRNDLRDESCRGDWRNVVALLSDDADPGKSGDTSFIHSSEAIATSIKQSLPQLNIDRLYADAFHQESGAIGSYYPDLNNALRQRLNYGCLLLNYIGHGSTSYIGTERYIEMADIDNYDNGDRMPLFVTSTCSYGRYDLPTEVCGAEACVLAPAAMIAVVSASRPISHIERFNKDVVCYALNPANTIGDALRMAKNRTSVSMSIGLIGDPALRLSQPVNRVTVTHINKTPVESGNDISADALSMVTVKGEIRDASGNLVDDFDGTVYPIVFDREMRSSTLANDNPGTQVSFWQQKTVLYKGTHDVSGGRFEYSFIVPKDVPYQYAYAKLSHYAKSTSDHATGSFLKLKLGGMSEAEYDTSLAPEIQLFLGDTNFKPGSMTGPSPTLVAFIADSAGINIGTGLGHDITAVLDDNPNSLIVLNDLYQQDINDNRRGSVSYTLRDLVPGRHTITVKAWNIFGISNSATVSFVVRGTDTLAFSELSCSPNPSTTTATFMLRVNDPDAISSTELQIYNSRGQMVAAFTPAVSTDGFLVGPLTWNVSTVPPGLYLARMVMTDKDGEVHQVVTKCIVR